VLADLHGGGDRSNELVVLEYEEIKQQVKFDLIEWVSMNKLNHSISAPCRFTSSATKEQNRIWTY